MRSSICDTVKGGGGLFRCPYRAESQADETYLLRPASQ